MEGASLWRTFWSRAGAVGVRIKIMGIVAVGILASAAAMVSYEQRDDLAALRVQLQERGIALATGLAAQSRDLILVDNQFALYTLIRDIRNADNDIAYVFVLDTVGNVLVHTFDSGFPMDLMGKNEVPAGKPFQVQRLQAERETIQDIAVPVLGGKAGIIRLGMSEATIHAIVATHVRHILSWVALVLALGLSVTYGLTTILTKPISQLAEATRAVGRGNFKWQTPVWAKDEIGTLGTAFSEMREELRRREEMRVQLLAKVIGAQETERKRIARELHDETSQALTSLMVGLKLIEDSSSDPQVNRKIAELRALTVQTLNEVHHLAIELRPPLLDDLGLFAAIQRYTQEYSVKTHIRVDCHVSDANGQRLSPEREVAVYRITQEALTNIARHAEAKNVSVVLGYRGSSLVAIIEDDGKGFDVNQIMISGNGKSLGVFGMYERAFLVGGKLTIESQPGSGTTVFLEVPLQMAEERRDGQNKGASG